MRIASIILLPALLVACIAVLAMPGSMALAADDLPQEMVDPVAAIDPAVESPAPAPVAAVPAAAPAAEAQGAAAPGAEAARAAEPASSPAEVAGATAPAAAVPVGAGSLPFTGPDSFRLTWLLLVGSLLLAAGAVACCWPRATASNR